MRILWLFIALPVFAQVSTTSNTVTSSNMVRGTLTTSGRPFMGTPVVGAPYSAQRVTEHLMVGSDGTRFNQTNQQEKLYRDSQGRTRTERPLGPPNLSGPPMLVEIQDPVAMVGYMLDVQNKVAHRYQLKTPEFRSIGGSGAPGGIMGGGSGSGTGYGVGGGVTTAVRLEAVAPVPLANRAGSAVHPDTKRDDLGEQVIEGVLAKGSRMTTTWPTGSQGNDRPFSTTNETWMSADLKEMVLSINTDPRSGENTTKLVNVSRTEPSADLFMPPADYQIVDDSGPFQIHLEAQHK
jgi:hypothetical protein